MKKFILGFVMAIISIVGILIFVVKKAIVKAAKISNFSPIQEFAKEFVKNTIDILFWGRVRSEEERNPFDYRSYQAQKHNDICKAIDKCMAKSDKSDDVHYFIEAEEFGGDGIYTKENYIYLWDTKTLKWLDRSWACNIVGPDWLVKMIEGYVSGYSVAAGKIDTEAKTVYIRDQDEDRDYCIYIRFGSEE